jgi:hypothetical protein
MGNSNGGLKTTPAAGKPQARLKSPAIIRRDFTFCFYKLMRSTSAIELMAESSQYNFKQAEDEPHLA